MRFCVFPLIKILIDKASKAKGKRIVDLQVPTTVNILAIKRNDMFITPKGSTKVVENDILHVLAEDKYSLELLYKALGLADEKK